MYGVRAVKRVVEIRGMRVVVEGNLKAKRGRNLKEGKRERETAM